MWDLIHRRNRPGLRVLTMRQAPSVHLLSVLSSYFWQAWSPLTLGHAIIIMISRAPGAQLCLAAIVHSRSPDALACIQDPSYRSMIYNMPGGNPEDTAHDTPARPSLLQICICRFSPRGPLGPGIPFRQTLWRFALTVLGKQSGTSPNVMLMDSNTNACLFGQIRYKHHA